MKVIKYLSEDETGESSGEEEDGNDANKEGPAKCPPVHQTQTTQKLSSGEYSQAQQWTGETKSSGTSESSQHSSSGQKYDVFLSHSGKQKNFVRQLYIDLTNQGLSCFFDEDRHESLPVGDVFPPRIFEAVETCGVALFLLSKEFLESKWPMLELETCVKSRGTNAPAVILPLFFIISPAYLKKTAALNEKWEEIGIEEQQCVGWHKALETIRPIIGLKFNEGGNEVQFRDEIVNEIWGKLPAASPRYHVPFLQGEHRMCQEVAEFFDNVKPNEKGIRIAGLYGIAGQGKTTLGKAFCNFKLKDFKGKVCHLDFSRGDSIERAKIALRYLIHCPQSRTKNFTEDQAEVALSNKMNGQRVLLVLDNITEEINIKDEVRVFIKANFGTNSCILLSARSIDVLVKCYRINPQSCMRIPSLEKDDAIAILVGSTSSEVSTLGEKDKCFALECANRCAFQELCRDNGRRVQRFHPLALKAFGSYLSNKFGSNLSQWVAELDGLGGGCLYGLHNVFGLLDKNFNDMEPKHRTIFMLLALYIPTNTYNVTKWLAISSNESIDFVKKAVEYLSRKAFIEEFSPEICIHDLYIEFAQSKANKMERWLCWKGDEPRTRGFISQDNQGFELAKMERCMHRDPSQIAPRFHQNLLLLQLVGMQNMSKLGLAGMDCLRSITIHDCKVLEALEGMENLVNLAWVQIREVDKMLKLPKLSSFSGLQYLEIDVAVSQVISQLGDLTPCSLLQEINVRCPSLLEFPKLNGLLHLEKVEFSMCDKVKGPLDCTGCVELQSIVLNSCCEMAAPPRIAGCNNVSKIVLFECYAVRKCQDMDMSSALKTLELHISSCSSSVPKSLKSCCRLESLKLWNMGGLERLPSFRSLSNLTVLEIGKCGITEPPDLTCCVLLEDVYFFSLKHLIRFPNFSLLRKLKKLILYNCTRVVLPPDITGCHELWLFNLLYNHNMKGVSKIDKCPKLEEIKVSWQSNNKVRYEGFDEDTCEADDDHEACLECFKNAILENLEDVSVPEELKQWLKNKTMMAKKYFHGVKLYYSVTAPYESYKREKLRDSDSHVTLRLVKNRVLAFPTQDEQDDDWLDTVQAYFAQHVITCRSTPSAWEISEAISLVPRYHVSSMQGQRRICQEVAAFVSFPRAGLHGEPALGLYGEPGLGKTTIAKAFCNHELRNFAGKVCLLQFCEGNALDRQKHALHYFTQFSTRELESVTSIADARYMFRTFVKGERVLLVLDSITEDNIDEVRHYLQAEYGNNSCILLIAQSVDVLESFNIESWSSMHVPRLEEEEALAILLGNIYVEESALGAENRGYALKCANICSFREGRDSAPTFHPLALKIFGRHLFRKHGSDLSKWVADGEGCTNGDSGVWGNAFDNMDPRYRRIFVFLATHMPQSKPLDDVVRWAATNCNEEIAYIKKAVRDLCDDGFIEEIEPQICITDLIKKLVQVMDSEAVKI